MSIIYVRSTQQACGYLGARAILAHDVICYHIDDLGFGQNTF